MRVLSFRKSERYFRLLKIDPKNYFYTLKKLKKLLKSGKARYLSRRVVIYDRSSHSTQDKKGNMKSRRSRITMILEAMGFEVVGYFCETINGRSQYLEDRTELKAAVELTKSQKATLVFPSVERAVRPEEFHAVTNPRAPLLKRDMDRFEEIVGKIAVAVIVPPGVSERSFLTECGQAGRNKRGGRPKKKKPGDTKKRRETYLLEAINCLELGMSFREIAEYFEGACGVKIGHTTIHGWIKRYKKRE